MGRKINDFRTRITCQEDFVGMCFLGKNTRWGRALKKILQCLIDINTKRCLHHFKNMSSIVTTIQHDYLKIRHLIMTDYFVCYYYYCCFIFGKAKDQLAANWWLKAMSKVVTTFFWLSENDVIKAVMLHTRGFCLLGHKTAHKKIIFFNCTVTSPLLWSWVISCTVK